MDNNFNIFMERQEEAERGQSLPLFKEYAIDFETCQPLYKDNEIVVLEGKEALKVWIFRALKTELNTYAVHSDKYGNELREHIGTVYNESIKQVIMKEQIRDCLLVNPYLTNVYNFEFEKLENDLEISFYVDTVYGEVKQEVMKLGY